MTENLNREKNKVVKTFVNTVNEAEIPSGVLEIKLPGNEQKSISDFTLDDFKSYIKQELDKPDFSDFFKNNEEEKSKMIDLFATTLNHGVTMKLMADRFAEKMNSNTLNADANDMDKIENIFKFDKFSSNCTETRNELAKLMSKIDTRKLDNNNPLKLLSNTAKGIMFFNSLFDTNLKVTETSILIDDEKQAREAIRAADNDDSSFTNDPADPDTFINLLNNEELLEERKKLINQQKELMERVGSDFEQSIFREDIEKMDNDLKRIDSLEEQAKVGFSNQYVNAYKNLDAMKNWLDIDNTKSPFCVPAALKQKQKDVENMFTSSDSTPEQKKALSTYLSKLNKTLQSYGYDKRISKLPTKTEREEIFNQLKQNVEQDIYALEKNGLNRKAFEDPEGFLEDLHNRRGMILNSDLFNRSYALDMAKDTENKLVKIDTLLEKRTTVASKNQKAADNVEKAIASFKNIDHLDTLNTNMIETKMANLFDRLGDKDNPFHINTPAFRKMKNVMKKFKEYEEYQDRLAKDDVDDYYEYHMKKGSLNEANLKEYMQEAHDYAQAYLDSKEKQTRKNPSEMRLTRLETAKEIVKLTAAYLKTDKSLEDNNRTIKYLRDHSMNHMDKYDLDSYRDKANLVVPSREKPVMPKIKSKEIAPQKTSEKKITEKKVENEKPTVSRGAIQ